MQKILAWDLPIRLLHWLLALSFGGAFLLAVTTSDEGALFPYHAVLGLTALFLVAVRLVWGVIGTRHARFSAFALRPSKLFRYFASALSEPVDRTAGHNPATSYFAVLLLACILGLGVTGISLSRGSESAEEIHEALAWLAGALVLVHLAGIFWHTIRHRENVSAAMISGRKLADPAERLTSHRAGTALLIAALAVVWISSLLAGYEPGTRTLRLPVSGLILTLGEAEEDHDRREEDHHRWEDDDD
jgi:cytochrome b